MRSFLDKLLKFLPRTHVLFGNIIVMRMICVLWSMSRGQNRYSWYAGVIAMVRAVLCKICGRFVAVLWSKLNYLSYTISNNDLNARFINAYLDKNRIY